MHQPMDLKTHQHKKAFTLLELLVAVSVTALLAGMLLNITSQVVQTQTRASEFRDESSCSVRPRSHSRGSPMCDIQK